MNMTRKLALPALGIALALGGTTAAPATAQTAQPARAHSSGAPAATLRQPAAQARCSVWKDHAGPVGAGRAHAKCPGWYVRVKAYCDNGSISTSAWLKGYAKAE
ncbi:hypothetical protein [Streptomyces rapamycinicus]|uniref:Uncharacterized protein n=2 Tax=Streptomyces rapamycinicus TaxID=1226757 RepID=A0A0A0N3B2_STRRN|nr:hypothetical protein [Streptomyces rapamycinicus]AGP51907.1 hypothetical protein M271_01350 [Streptomyces rapamycinicus NRRL 5491]MBB4779327.1 hypothetical protein [Streptomyces rapamycinicus]RLV76010.1 hypothetical protein D3C57_142330 [Streptomyces rapamycinicus NRRL 5491]UTP28111.1 hypothetical protein LIV37_01300 [Streptomyces rapamycinicus NRRL 5491]